MAHSFYVIKKGSAKSVDNVTSPKKTNVANGNPAGDRGVVSKTGSKSGSVPAGG